jgi:NAD(P)-dependent dehydrogenase (short-subunit alcohol dehydrogenase family)
MVANLGIKRVSDPAETAAAITFLASPAASYITGAVLDSNGGTPPEPGAAGSGG